MLSRPKQSSADLPQWAREWQRTLFDAGWLVPGWPPELGGRNANPMQQMIYFEEMSRREIPRSLNPQGLGIIAPSIKDYGTPEQREKFLLPTLRAEIAWCLGMSEPGHARENPAMDRMRRAILQTDDPGALLCVELYADRADDLPPRLEAIERDLAPFRCVHRRAVNVPDQARIWSFREASLGLSMAMKGDEKSLSFVEDTAVRPERAARLHRRVPADDPPQRQLLRRLRARLRRLPPRPARSDQPSRPPGNRAFRGHRQAERRSRAEVWRRVVR